MSMSAAWQFWKVWWSACKKILNVWTLRDLLNVSVWVAMNSLMENVNVRKLPFTYSWPAMGKQASYDLQLVGSHPLWLLLGIVDEVIEPPEVIVPELGQDNSITFVVQTYSIDEVEYLTSSYIPACKLCFFFSVDSGKDSRIPCSDCSSHHKILWRRRMPSNLFWRGRKVYTLQNF